MAHLLILGASGGTGRQVVAQALDLGHEVTAFVRRADRLPVTHERLRVITGQLPQDVTALDAAVRGQDAVISALGVGQSLKSGGLIERSMPVLVAALERAGVRRLIITSAYGVGTTFQDVPLLPRALIRVLLRDLYADKHSGEEILRRSGLDWTLVYPTTLTNGPKTGAIRAGERLQLAGLPRISRADLASVLLAQIEDRTYLRKGVLVTT